MSNLRTALKPKDLSSDSFLLKSATGVGLIVSGVFLAATNKTVTSEYSSISPTWTLNNVMPLVLVIWLVAIVALVLVWHQASLFTSNKELMNILMFSIFGLLFVYVFSFFSRNVKAAKYVILTVTLLHVLLIGMLWREDSTRPLSFIALAVFGFLVWRTASDFVLDKRLNLSQQLQQ